MEVMEKLPNDGKSPLWHIEKRMVMDPNYHFPHRDVLNRMYAIISMDRDICLHTKSNVLVMLWQSCGLPKDTIAKGNWWILQCAAENLHIYNFMVAVYQDLLKKRNAM